jgi:flagellar biosynthesis protein
MSPAQKTRLEAVALAYAPRDGAPRVVAKGRGLVAEEIIARAREAGVFVHESPELVSLLMQVDLDDRIPPALYVAVAELLAWIYRLEQGLPMNTALAEDDRLPHSLPR